jgi:hypothetical protein
MRTRVHYKNDIPPLRSRNSSSSDNRNGSDLVVIDATNINRSMRMAFNDPCVNTCNASIDTSINESTFLSTTRGLYRVHILLLTWHAAQVENIIHILVAYLALQCLVNRVPLHVVFQCSKRCRVKFDPLLEFENKILYHGGKMVCWHEYDPLVVSPS